MRALVLLGGQGTRLRPLTYEIPKPMLPVVDRPMIFQIVEWLSLHGVTKVVFALGYHSAAFLDAFREGSYAGVEVVTATEPSPLDTAGAIAFASDVAGVAGERLIVVNGDILTDLDLGELVTFHERHGASATIALTPVADPSAFGVVPTDDNGRVLAFIEKPSVEEAPTNMVNAGTYVLEPSVLARINRGVRVSIEREIFPLLVEHGELYAMASSSYWLDTGTPDRYLQAQSDVLSGLRPRVMIPANVCQEGMVHIGPNVSLLGAIEGPSFLGANASVGVGASIRASVIGERSSIGAGVQISGSVVMSGASIGAGSVLERCIIGHDARVGANVKLQDTIIGSGFELAPDAHLFDARLPG